MTIPSSLSVGPAMTSGPTISMTERALREITKIFEDGQSGTDVGLRISVQSGGCSGLSYEMGFAKKSPGDLVVDLEAIQVYLDAKSSVYIRGTTIDFEGGLRGKGFVFSNPNASKTCSCGDSFGV
ncbi:MAG: iron-sulfur cluster assembly accessory protein [Acidobacteria bacterium]|nr:MAG: iron-sulfur cluster assembly accessory protein [Acidobacteriota bacterium]